MKILTLDNRTYKLEKIPEWVDENLRFAVLDNSDPANPDFFYIPLIFLESFNGNWSSQDKDAVGLENAYRRSRTIRDARVANHQSK